MISMCYSRFMRVELNVTASSDTRLCALTLRERVTNVTCKRGKQARFVNN